ncbi:MAG: RNA polymerase sigma factor [Lachnospiraceae bacterium]|nr:RNA polymerase sigma factor [Lachnospiraceae bacterium]
MLLLYCAMLDTEHERDELTKIYEEHKHAMFMYALKMTKDNELAEDAVHNAFLSIINHKEKYFSLNHKEFRCLSVVIVKNKCIDLLRKEKHYAQVPFEELELYLDGDEEPIEEQVIAKTTYIDIRNNMKNLDEISRQVLIMKYYFDMSYKEIGKELNMTPKHIDIRIMRAKEKMRKLIKMDEKYYEQ